MTTLYEADAVDPDPRIQIDYSPHRVNSSGGAFADDLPGSDLFDTQVFGAPQIVRGEKVQKDELPEVPFAIESEGT